MCLTKGSGRHSILHSPPKNISQSLPTEHPATKSLWRCLSGGGRVLCRQVIITSLQKPNKFLFNSLSINSATGALSLPSTSQQIEPAGQKPLKDDIEYAAPLCTSLDGNHIYVVYPSEKVSFGKLIL